MTNQRPADNQDRWQRLLNLGEHLMAQPTFAAQRDLIQKTTAHLLNGQAHLWLTESFYKLLASEKASPLPDAPHSDLMRRALDQRTAIAQTRPTAAVAVPLMIHQSVLGVVQVTRPNGPPFEEEEIQLLNGLAIQSALALQSTRQVTIERWRIKQLALVRQVSDQVANLLNLDELLTRVADLILRTFDYYYVALFSIEPDQQTLRFRASAGPLTRQPDEPSRGERVLLQAEMGRGIIGHVAQTGREILASEVSREPRYRHEDSLPETKSEVALPLKIENRLLGVLDVQSNQLDDFDETDMLVLRALAHNISLAIEDARLYGDLQRRAEQLSAMAEVSRAVNSILDLNKLLEEVVNRIHQRFGYPLVQLFTVHTDRRQIAYRAGNKDFGQPLGDQELFYSLDDPQGIIPAVARSGTTKLVSDVKQEPAYRPSRFLSDKTRAELVVPLIFGNEVLGVLDIQSDRKGTFGDDDRSVFEALADNVAIALRNANLYRSERWRRQVADSLHQVAGLLSSEAPLNQVYHAILAELNRNLPCDIAAIWLVRGETLHLAAARGYPEEEIKRAIDLLSESSSWLAQALQADQPTIRTAQSHFEPLGTAIEFPTDYSAIAAPLRAGDRRLGVLALAHHQPERYGPESQAMTATFASYAAVALENARLFEAAQEQAWVSTVLLQVAEATQSLTSLDEILESVVRLVPMLVGAKRCALMLSLAADHTWGENHGETFVAAASYGLDSTQQAAFKRWSVAPKQALAFDHLRLTKTPIVIEDPSADPRLPKILSSEFGFESLLLMPLLTRGEVSGVMLVDYRTDQRELSDERQAMIRGIAHQTATAIENTQLLEARQEEAYVSAALLQAAQAVVSFNNLNEILNAIVRITPMLVGVRWSVIFLWDDERSLFRLTQAYGISFADDTSALAAAPYAPGDFPLLDAIRRDNEPLTLEDRRPDWEDMIPAEFAASLGGDSETHSLVGVPLSVAGNVLGVMLTEEDNVPRRFRHRRIEILTGIGQQAALAIQNDRLQQEVAQRERLEQELQLAREIQQTFMPSQLPDLPGWELAVEWQAARQVAGDFYDFFELPDKRLGLIIADVADKGIPAALFMTLTRTLVRAAALEDDSPAAVLNRVNELLIPDAQQGMFVTAIYAVLSLETGQLVYTSAGHNPPLLLRSKTKQLESLQKGGIALGVLEGIQLEERVITLETDDYLVFYTDGITEAFSVDDAFYGEQRLQTAIADGCDGSAQSMLNAISASVSAFVGDNAPSDDITMMVLHRLTGSGEKHIREE